ncbi:DUF4426 domain-containing protein [Pleionea sp. CnH1-48]|uniref:DUF4426 domain-containing protein n=1 Tax=Pleionea sp. CnH1-48 TaxID=2954494 RepID=UPI0020975236|nr:DUF4426 domain-containing protein [Pleionea sp. CnH1-48]MCO7225273.1 DUF4426 domain-containing protein [Pleionea sp. CnH1-48]
MNIRRIISLCVSYVLLTICSSAQAEQSKNIGDYVVHYNAFTSDFISPETARQYGIQRSKALGLVNITVLKQNTKTPVGTSANIIGNAYNLAGQNKDLAFKEIREGDAIYYLANFRFANAEKLTFKLKITPRGEETPLDFQFTQQLYTSK